jgi:hypothetical protein
VPLIPEMDDTDHCRLFQIGLLYLYY